MINFKNNSNIYKIKFSFNLVEIKLFLKYVVGPIVRSLLTGGPIDHLKTWKHIQNRRKYLTCNRTTTSLLLGNKSVYDL